MAAGGLGHGPQALASDPRGWALSVDLNQPWFAPWAPVLALPLQALRLGHSVAQALNQALSALGPNHPAQGICFVPQTDLPPTEAYEAYIHRTRQVPTRDHLHDLLNGVCWLRYPAIKRHLNALQAEQIERTGVGQTRGPVRDALTLMDENAILLSGPGPLRVALAAHDWQALFVQHRALWAQARCVLFGHALLEKLVRPYKSITAHVWWVDGWDDQGDPSAWDAALDRVLPARLTAAVLATKPFMPLPVLGLPGWCPDNEDPAFYRDSQVFRPMRIKAPSNPSGG